MGHRTQRHEEEEDVDPRAKDKPSVGLKPRRLALGFDDLYDALAPGQTVARLAISVGVAEERSRFRCGHGSTMREKGKERGVAGENKRVVRLYGQELYPNPGRSPRQCLGVGSTCHVCLIMPNPLHTPASASLLNDGHHDHPQRDRLARALLSYRPDPGQGWPPYRPRMGSW